MHDDHFVSQNILDLKSTSQNQLKMTHVASNMSKKQTLEQSINHYSRSNNMTGMIDDIKLQDLHARLDKFIDRLDEWRKTTSPDERVDTTPDEDKRQYVWTIPTMILLFLQNVIEKHCPAIGFDQSSNPKLLADNAKSVNSKDSLRTMMDKRIKLKKPMNW